MKPLTEKKIEPCLVSIIIPTYNCGAYISSAIESVLSQIYPNVELIVVDDGSTDNTKEILRKYGNRIKYIYQQNKGQAAASNAGFKISTGTYVAFFDADDVLLNEKIASQVSLLDRNPDVGAAYCWYHFINKEGILLPQKGRVKKRGDITADLLEGSLFPNSSLLFKREALNSAGLFDESLHAAEDWDLCLRVARKGYKFDYVPEYLVKYRVHGASICDNHEKMEKNDLKFIEKAFSGQADTGELRGKKGRALFSVYNEHAWHYFAKNDMENGLQRLVRAMEVYPEGYSDYQSFFYFAHCIMPRGYRVNEEVYKEADHIKNIFNNALDYLFARKTIESQKAIRASKDMALGWIFYFARDMKEARSSFLRAFISRPSYLLKPINIFTLLKSFLSENIIGSLKGYKNTKSILYILDIFPAVSETFILNEILELERRGYEVVVFARRREDSTPHGIACKLKAKVVYLPDAHGVKSTSLIISHIKMLFLHPINYTRTLRFALKRRYTGHLWFFKVSCYYADMARKYKFAHIHSHFAAVASCYAMYISKLLCRHFTFTIHGWYDLYEGPPDDLSDRINEAKKVITISEYNKRYLIEKFDAIPGKIEVIHSGIDLSYFPRNSLHKKYTKIVLSVARLHPDKALGTLIKACGRLSQKRNDFDCLIIGEGDERQGLEKLINDNRLNNRISLVGAKKLEEVRSIYNSASVYVLPSKHETMGVTTMEAMASGLPVISSNIYGIPELVDHNVNGFLIPPGDDEQLADYLNELLDNENKRNAFGAMGRQKIEKYFNLETEVAKLAKAWLDGKD
ncbi:MAG: glycosyltransferase [Candidatus Omnitrophota bacterium]|nr:glycosyltransferase [Candidatus Omnitrophota bacterium]